MDDVKDYIKSFREDENLLLHNVLVAWGSPLADRCEVWAARYQTDHAQEEPMTKCAPQIRDMKDVVFGASPFDITTQIEYAKIQEDPRPFTESHNAYLGAHCLRKP